MKLYEVLELIKKDETRIVELKKTTGELIAGLKSVCAMLNSDGGYVIFGIAPTSLKILGQMVTDNTRQEIGNEIRKLEPYVNMPVDYVDIPDSGGKQLIVLHADRNLYADAPYVYDGKPYYKLESTTARMPQQMYEEMLRQRDFHKFCWDAMTAEDVDIEDLDENRIRTAVTMGVKSGRLNPSAENESTPEVLAKLDLLNNGKPTNAAVVLFAKDTRNYPELELKMGYFKGNNRMVFIDNKMERGNFFDLHDAGIAFLFRNLRLSGEVKGLLREEKLEIPIEALREALTNAICHHQYERTNGSISLSIYDDRVEIVNPGKFPPQLTTDSIKELHESYPYNKKIAQVLYLTKNLEKWGTGANRMIDLCREQGIPEPEWKVANGTVTITFRRPPISTSLDNSNDITSNVSPEIGQNGTKDDTKELSERQQVILALIQKNDTITINEMIQKTNVSSVTIKRDLSLLQERNIIKREGGRKQGHWVIIEK